MYAALRWCCDVMKILVAMLRGAVHQQQRAAAYAALLPSLVSMTKSENLATLTGICRPRLPVLFYSTPLVMPQNCEMQVCQLSESNGLNCIFTNTGKGNCGIRFRTPLFPQVVLISLLKPISSSISSRVKAAILYSYLMFESVTLCNWVYLKWTQTLLFFCCCCCCCYCIDYVTKSCSPPPGFAIVQFCKYEDALKFIIPFPSSFLCEMGFSAVVFMKEKYRNRLDAEYPLRLALSDVEPRFQKLLKRNGD